MPCVSTSAHALLLPAGQPRGWHRLDKVNFESLDLARGSCTLKVCDGRRCVQGQPRGKGCKKGKGIRVCSGHRNRWGAQGRALGVSGSLRCSGRLCMRALRAVCSRAWLDKGGLCRAHALRVQQLPLCQDRDSLACSTGRGQPGICLTAGASRSSLCCFRWVQPACAQSVLLSLGAAGLCAVCAAVAGCGRLVRGL